MPRLDHLPGRAFRQKDREWLYFSGTAYLGIPHLPAFREALVEGFDRYGTNFGGSRHSNLQLTIFAEAEKNLAEWVGTEYCLTVSSGSLAGQLLMRFLRQQGPCQLAPNVHPALWPDADANPAHVSMTEWIERTRQMLPPVEGGPIQLFYSSVDPLLGTHVSFDWLQDLPASRPYRLVIDDSHGLGLLGPTGAGILPTLPKLDHIEYMVVGSLGKALGIPGGAIFGPDHLLENLRTSPFFIGASPIVPAYLYAWLQVRDVIQQQRDVLLQNIQWLEDHWPEHIPVQHQPAFPVFHLPQGGYAEHLHEHHILISAFPYPGPDDPVVERVVVNALHLKGDLEELVAKMMNAE